MLRLLGIALLALAAGCAERSPPVVFHPPDEIPEQLSDWGVLAADGNFLRVNADVLPYDLNTPLFTDYAGKLRTVWMPPGQAATYHAEREFEFPVGTIVSKTFHYEKAPGGSVAGQGIVQTDREADLDAAGRLDLERFALIETRLLVRYADGWQAFPYVWNRDQTEAWLEIAGDTRQLTLLDGEGSTDFIYVVPDVNQCSGCHAPDHTGRELKPIGLKARHLNRPAAHGNTAHNQIEHWRSSGVLEGVTEPVPAAARWSGTASLEARARAYLDINCAHCHNSRGAADTSGLHLDSGAALDRNFGLCKSPTAVGQGSGDRNYDIYPGKPEESILVYRMNHTDPAIAMPELGRSTVHDEGVLLISNWIASLEGGC